MFDVICIGNLNFDIIFKAVKLPAAHEKINCEQAFTALGGAAGNTASRLASLNYKIGFVGCVGNDPMGEQHLSEFKKLAIDTSQIKIVDMLTDAVSLRIPEQEIFTVNLEKIIDRCYSYGRSASATLGIPFGSPPNL